MRVAVFGTGGAGGYFGARLAQAGEDVAFIARGRHLEAIRENGLHVESTEGDFHVRPLIATEDPREIGPVDVVLVGLKTWQVADAAPAMRPFIGEDTMVVPLMNGVEGGGQLAAVLGDSHVVGGLCGTISWVSEPGRIRNVGATNFIRFGEIDNRRSDRTERLRAAFEKSGVTVEVPPDILKAVWEKFLLVTAFGGVGAVTRAPVGITRTMLETRRMLERCMEETFAVGRAEGVRLADSAVADGMAMVETFAPSATTSLQRDTTDGRPSELDAWNGAIVRLGSRHGIATPTHEFIYQSLLPLERQARGLVVFPL